MDDSIKQLDKWIDEYYAAYGRKPTSKDELKAFIESRPRTEEQKTKTRLTIFEMLEEAYKRGLIKKLSDPE